MSKFKIWSGADLFSVCLYLRFSVIDDRFLRDGSRVATIDVTMAKTLPILIARVYGTVDVGTFNVQIIGGRQAEKICPDLSNSEEPSLPVSIPLSPCRERPLQIQKHELFERPFSE